MAIRKKSRFERLLSLNQHRKRLGATDTFQKLVDVDIEKLKSRVVKGEELKYTHGSSKNINQHIQDLGREFIGKPELTYYHAQLIVYLRREYKVKETYKLFESLWEIERDFLLEHLNIRWIVSAADTFIDHSKDPLAVAVAMNVVTLANTIKLMETERYLQVSETLCDDQKRIEELMKQRVPLANGMSAFAVGTDDTLRNMRWRINKIGEIHPLGKMFIEVFKCFQEHESVYKRFKERHTRSRTAWWD